MSALPSAPNSLSINQIAQEFGGDTPHAISEYYAGGDNVPAGTQGEEDGIPPPSPCVPAGTQGEGGGIPSSSPCVPAGTLSPPA